MEKQETPTQAPMSDRHPNPWYDAVSEPEGRREEHIGEADEGDELPFELPRD